jgi:Mg2+-importing ATPase
MGQIRVRAAMARRGGGGGEGRQFQPPEAYWSVEPAELLRELEATPEGLSTAEAAERLEVFGANVLQARARASDLSIFLSQFKNPIILLLLVAAVVSFFLGDHVSAIIIVSIVVVSGALGFWQERGAARAVEALLKIVRVTATVLRDGHPAEVAVEEVVPGDVVVLNAGAVIPGDCRLLESRDLFVNEVALTGEAFPAEKEVGTLPPETAMARRTNVVYQGTHVESGEARALVVRTGVGTAFGGISWRLRTQPPLTEFERGVRGFGYFLMRVTFVLVTLIFLFNLVLDRPILESFLFSLALAVGLTPQLLPAIISVNLAHGARRMATRKVIVKRLASIQNFGSMNVLCCDKTGTLTEGVLKVQSTLDAEGEESERVFLFAAINAAFQTGFPNPIDAAILADRALDLSAYRKLDEIPYDFTRKRLSILAAHEGGALMVTKGAVGRVLEVCSTVERARGERAPMDGVKSEIEARVQELGSNGYRAIAVAYREMDGRSTIHRNDEAEMTFLGLVVFYDPPKETAPAAIQELARLGISLKIISGDSAPVVRFIGERVGLSNPEVLTGADVRGIDDLNLPRRVRWVQAFAEIEPDQKERILLALKEAGNVVGFIGDGINDAPAIRAADVGLSVDQAVDVAKEAADIVLLETDLGVLAHGVTEGRHTFANTMKYVFMATSANFGNMFSMAGASLFLPFLPLLPSQILLTNLLTDFPEMTISTDAVDPEMVARPRRWDIGFIRRFMYAFGLLSSIFDYLTFAVLLLLLRASPPLFRAGWFVESVVSASMVVLIIRSRRPFFRSMPGVLLTLATAVVVVVTVAIPFSPFARPLGFEPLPGEFLAVLVAILACYMAGAEVVKYFFYKRIGYGGDLPDGPGTVGHD